MGLFTRKEKIPDLPPAPSLPELPRMSPKKNLPELPSFPQSTKNEHLNRELVKSAVADDLNAEEEESHLEFPVMKQHEESMPLLLPPRANKEIPAAPKRIKTMISEAMEVQASEMSEKPAMHEPIFVRIDKFQASQEGFDKIVGKIKEIESTIAKLRKVKSQEEEELSKWSSEVEQLKNRLADIDENIFSQI
jgi:hypothetical protein